MATDAGIAVQRVEHAQVVEMLRDLAKAQGLTLREVHDLEDTIADGELLAEWQLWRDAITEDDYEAA